MESVINRFLNDRMVGGLVLPDVEGRRRIEEMMFRSHLQCDVWLETADVKVGEQKHDLEEISSTTRCRWDQRGNVFELTEIDHMVFTLVDLRKILKKEVRTPETAGAGGRIPYGGVSFPEFPSAAAYTLSGDGTQAIGSSSYHHTRLLQLMEDLIKIHSLFMALKAFSNYSVKLNNQQQALFCFSLRSIF